MYLASLLRYRPRAVRSRRCRCPKESRWLGSGGANTRPFNDSGREEGERFSNECVYLQVQSIETNIENAFEKALNTAH